ncbi:MAG: flavodoxin, partial [Bacteroidales bacterium]|nr:flavodoxin [Bacteroidales bacterium]
MNIKNLLVSVLAVVLATGCNGQNKNYAETFQETSLQNEQTSNSKKMKKSIVIFFSHAGDNYSVGVIDTGNTKIVADHISEITGADQFEIVTHKYDGMAYTPLIELAKKEAAAGELPPYEGAAPDLRGYDTVFIGGPV